MLTVTETSPKLISSKVSAKLVRFCYEYAYSSIPEL